MSLHDCLSERLDKFNSEIVEEIKADGENVVIDGGWSGLVFDNIWSQSDFDDIWSQSFFGYGRSDLILHRS